MDADGEDRPEDDEFRHLPNRLRSIVVEAGCSSDKHAGHLLMVQILGEWNIEFAEEDVPHGLRPAEICA
jgi:hypothetical protein